MRRVRLIIMRFVRSERLMSDNELDEDCEKMLIFHFNQAFHLDIYIYHNFFFKESEYFIKKNKKKNSSAVL